MRFFGKKQDKPQTLASSDRARSNMASIPAVPAHALFHLQRAAGNFAVQQMLPSRSEGSDVSLTTVPGTIQTKLTVNKPGDKYEQEADRIADQVTASPVHSKPESAPPHIQRFAGSSTVQPATTPASVDRALSSPGSPLEPSLRQDMEQRFGQDFSQVRVHTGEAAEESAQDVNANAYTVGHNIVFGAGQPAPGSRQGKKLLAHELTHVVQQRSRPALADRIVQRQPSALEESTSQEERGNLRVLTLEGVAMLSPDEIDKEFKQNEKGNIPVDDVKFGPGIAEGIKRGLQNIAARFFSDKSFTFNTVTNVALNLKAFGGVNGVYRFTLVERKRNPKRQLIIEQVSATPPSDPGKIDVQKARKRFESFGFTLGPGFGSDDDRKLLFAALDRVSDSILNRLRGLNFAKHPESVGETGEPGHYDPNTHTIRLYASSLRKLMNSIDFKGADFFTGTLAHELGHALDYQSFTAAKVKGDALAKQLKEAQIEARRVATPLGDEKAQAEKVKKDQQEIDRLIRALSQANADFEKAQKNLDMNKGGEHSQSTKFARAKGKPISTYGKKANVENFAELASLFILDPDLLKSLRPDAYKYFSDTF